MLESQAVFVGSYWGEVLNSSKRPKTEPQLFLWGEVLKGRKQSHNRKQGSEPLAWQLVDYSHLIDFLSVFCCGGFSFLFTCITVTHFLL